jgi:7-cyano-7-deazaguanine synthase
MKTALLLSGGMDSVALAWWLRPDVAMTIDYGQRPAPGEIRAATAVAAELKIPHEIVHADVSQLGSGDLAGTAASPLAPVKEWWPFRNQFLVTVAAMRGVSLGVQTLLIGCLRTDAVHSDGSQAFVQSLGHLLGLQEGALKLEAPAIGLDGAELIRRSGVPDEILAWSHSCHVSEYACGECRGCRKHYETLTALGVAPY